MTQTYCERFKAEEVFGAKFIYCLDRSLQLFFRKVEKGDRVSSNELADRAEDFLARIEGGYDVSVRLPTSLLPAPTPAAHTPNANAPLAITDGATQGGPAKKKRNWEPPDRPENRAARS